MFHVKQRKLLGLVASLGVLAVVATGCISDDTRGWASPTTQDDTQVVTTSRGRLDGINTAQNPQPAWTGTLASPLIEDDNRLRADAISPSDLPYQGDILRIGTEMVRVRSLSFDGPVRELHLDRGYGGTVRMSHAAGTEIEAFRRPWRFPDDWDIRQSSARSLGGIYGQPVADSDGVLYLGDYRGWVYAFRPDEVNRDARDSSEEPKVAVANLRDRIIGGVVLDEDNGRLYAAAGANVYLLSLDRLKAALTAGGGEVDADASFQFQAADQLWSTPVLDGDLLLVAGLDGVLYGLDASTGAERWRFEAPAGLMTTPVISDGLVLVAGFSGNLYAVDINTGEEVWSFAARNWILAAPIIEDGVAYFGDFDGVVHAVDVTDGSERWALALDRGEIRAAAAIVDDMLVVGTDNGWLIGVNLQQQQQAWIVNLGTALHADLVVADGEVLLAPSGCVTPEGSDSRVYYRAVDPANGGLSLARGVC